MTDRTSYTYRAETPGQNPDMYSQGGAAREAFRQARMSPYIRKHSQEQTHMDGDPKIAFKAVRQSKQTSPKHGQTHNTEKETNYER